VALGILTAVYVGAHEAKKRGISRDQFIDFSTWVIIPAFIGARLFHAVFYEPTTFLQDPVQLLYVWQGGLSWFGGLIGAGGGIWLFGRRHNVTLGSFAQAAAFSLPLGCGIGRIGCFFIHDHPGTLRESGFLTVKYPGGDRYDHGLLLSMVGFAIFLFFLWIRKRSVRGAPDYLAYYFLLYGSARFILDFFRAWDLMGADARYFLLTPAQYGSLALIIAGLVLMRRKKQAEQEREPVLH